MKILCWLGFHKWGDWERTQRIVTISYYFKPPAGSWEKKKHVATYPGMERKCRRCKKAELEFDERPEIELPHGIYDLIDEEIEAIKEEK